MINREKIKAFCRNTIRVVLFIIAIKFWQWELTPLFKLVLIYTPNIVFILCAFFMGTFIVRSMGTFLFMPKDKLKAILRNSQVNPTLKEKLPRALSLPFLKRIGMYGLLFILEYALRIYSILLYQIVVKIGIPAWAHLAEKSDILLITVWTLIAFLLMELPFYLLFYRFSFKGKPNRYYEYRYGMKIVLFIAGVFILSLPLSLINNMATAITLLVILSIGLWYLMYRAKCSCFSSCPICNAVGGLFSKEYKFKQEEAELQCTFESAEKVAEAIIEAEGKDGSLEISNFIIKEEKEPEENKKQDKE